MPDQDDELIETALTFVGAKVPAGFENEADMVHRKIDFE